MSHYEVDFDLPSFGLNSARPAVHSDDNWVPDDELRKLSPTFDRWMKRLEARDEARWEGREPEPVDDLSFEEMQQVERDKQAYFAATAEPAEPDLEGLTRQQREAVLHLRETQEELFGILTEALREHARGEEIETEEDESPEFDELFESLEHDDEPDDFASTFGVQRILVLESGTLAFLGWAKWEEEHGFGAFMRGDVVLEIGYQSLVPRE